MWKVGGPCSVRSVTEHMAAHRLTAVVVVDHDSMGIFTERDVVSRIVSRRANPDTTTVLEVMTRNPDTVTTTTTAAQALAKMQGGKFRHLPVVDDEQNVVAILDILKITYDSVAEQARDSSWLRQRFGRALGFFAQDDSLLADTLTDAMAGDGGVTTIDESATVQAAADIMARRRISAILVTKSGLSGVLAGIFTETDVLRRVVARGMEPESTLLSSVMTRDPACVTPATPPVAALQMMHNGHFRHLPVVEDKYNGAIVGLLDILKLTSDSGVESQAPVVAKSARRRARRGGRRSRAVVAQPQQKSFLARLASALDLMGEANCSDDSSAALSDEEDSLVDSDISFQSANFHLSPIAASHAPPSVSMTDVSNAGEEASGVETTGGDVSATSTVQSSVQAAPEVFFKFQVGDEMHRAGIACHSLAQLTAVLVERCPELGGKQLRLKYRDEDGDLIRLASDAELEDAIKLYFRLSWSVIRLDVTAEAPRDVPPTADEVKDRARPLVMDGDAHVRESKFADAVAKYTAALDELAAGPDGEMDRIRVGVLKKRADVRSIMGEYELACADFDLIIAAAADNAAMRDEAIAGQCEVLMEQTRFEAVFAALERVTLADVRQRVREQMHQEQVELKAQGASLWRKADYTGAMACYTNAIRINTGLTGDGESAFAVEAALWSNRAACYLKLQDYDMALDDCNECIRRAPTFIKAYLRKGQCLYYSDRKAEALQVFKDGLAVEPTNEALLAEVKRVEQQLNPSNILGESNAANAPPASAEAKKAKDDAAAADEDSAAVDKIRELSDMMAKMAATA